MDITAIQKLTEQGVLAILLAISIGANYFFIKGWLGEKDKRVGDAQSVSDKIIGPLDKLQKTIDSMNTLLQIIAKK